MTRSALGFRADVVLGVQLVLRHRPARLVSATGLLILVVGALGGADWSVSGPGLHYLFVLSGSLAAIAGSRLLAPGAAAAAARRAAGPWWQAPLGRLIGAGLVISPVLIAATVALAPTPLAGLRAGLVAGLYAAALGAMALALAPLIGGPSGGAVALLAAWFGAIPPSAMHLMLDGWSYVQRPVVLLWNVLPLDWRAVRIYRSAPAGDVVLFLGWVAACVAIAAWASARVFRRI